MLLGTGASHRLVRDYPGMTVHRRSVQLKKYFVDLHMRVREALVATPAFGGDGYLSMLGQELRNMQSGAFENLVDYLLEYLTLTAPGGDAGGTTVLGTFPGDYGLYARMTDTAIYRSLRYMMCKSDYKLYVCHEL